MPCRFDEFTADIVENQVLKAALLRLRADRRSAAREPSTLGGCAAFFDEVADDRTRPDVVDRIYFHRLNEHYEPALRLAQLVLRNLTLARPARRHESRAASSST